jgi:arginyl-tRNA synthetase
MEQILKVITAKAIDFLYKEIIEPEVVQVQKTKKEFDGDFTIVVFPLLRYSSKNPEETAKELGDYLKNNIKEISNYNVIKGFLNIVLTEEYWAKFIRDIYQFVNYGIIEQINSPKNIVVEFSSPNTNKPLHLGHIRNNLLGDSLSRILKSNGHNIHRVNLVNDRGIHICKSMLAYQKWGENKNPKSENKKGDHFVGDYYVLFEKMNKKEIDRLVTEENKTIDDAKKESTLIVEAQKMLKKWERENKQVKDLWNLMNSWVLEGFNETYKKLGIVFDKTYFESETYNIGKEIVLKSLKTGVTKIKGDDTVYIDLKDEGLDEKVLLRSDGTSVYITQDIGTAVVRYQEFNFDNHIYVVGNEQEYHFQVLRKIIEKFGYTWSNRLEHFSYGMVELPDGKMKSREGKVVDADDLIDEMIFTAKEKAAELGKLNDIPEIERNEIIEKIALGALKYFILKVDPKKNMIFNPEESIDFNGNTGPFIQYTYTRIQSILRNAKEKNIIINENFQKTFSINNKEIDLIRIINEFPALVKEAGKKYSPAFIANYVYELAKEFNQYYHDFSILNELNENYRSFRIILSEIIGRIIKNSLHLLGIEVPDRM